MLKPQDLKQLEKKLKDCTTVAEMFKVLEENFQLDKCSPGAISKPLFISGIMKGIQLINPQPK